MDYGLQGGRYPHKHLHHASIHVSGGSFKSCVHIEQTSVARDANVEAHKEEEPGEFGSETTRR